MAVTMRDVAARAGVSPVVVSRVLHNKALAVRVSEATAERVREAAKDLGYRCNIWARNFRAQETQTIGVLHGIGFARMLFDSGSRYFAALMDGIVGGSFEHGYSISLCPKLMGTTPEDSMNDGRFDGLIWYSTFDSKENREMLLNCRTPLVLIHLRSSDFEDRFPAVVCDNDQAIALGIDHLVQLGHRRIAFASEEGSANIEAARRAQIFVDEMIRWDLPSSADDVIRQGYESSDIDQYFDAAPDHTAIIASNEGLAVQYMRRAQARGLRIPEDLSIMGFDSTSYCLEQRPTLTCISQPLSEMGTRASQMLVELMRGGRPDPWEEILPCSLDVRESTAPPKTIQTS